MSLHIIDNRPIDLTDVEWKLYEEICTSYDHPPGQRGKDLFVGIFETDDNGTILFLKSPKRQTSFEILFFAMSVMQTQQLRRAQSQVDAACARIDAKLADLNRAVKTKK